MKRKTLLIAAVVFILMAGTATAAYFATAGSGKKTGATAAAPKKTASNDAAATAPKDKEVSPAETDGSVTLTLYFSDNQAQYLLAEKRVIDKPDDVYQAALSELMKGSQDTTHATTIPANMVVVDLTVADGTATVDFGKAMNELVPRGSTGESIFLYSIVDTLTAFPEIKRVKFLAGGSAPEVTGSHINWAAAFERNETLIRK